MYSIYYKLTVCRNTLVINKLIIFLEITGELRLIELWGKCPITMIRNKRPYIATVTRGMKKTLQAPSSDVSLDIPDGHRGVYVKGVHTNHSSVCHILDKKECFISPAVEVTFKFSETECNADDAESLTINIHIV